MRGAGRPESVTAYIARFPPPTRAVLKKVRAAMQKALPGATEIISYSIPAYRVNGRVAVYFAGWKEHYSVYPATAPLVAEFKERLGPYEVNNKGTIRFPLSEPVPVKLIADLARFRAKQTVAEGARARAASTGARKTRASAGRRRA
jgi:uncharacterized protein YdhG (YjbR/CyaY superfamily)